MSGSGVVARSFLIGVLTGACVLLRPLGLAATWLDCALQVALAALAAGLASSVIGRGRRPGEALTRSFAAAGAGYALVLGLLIATGCQQHAGTASVVAREAGAVAGLERMAHALPVESRAPAREAARAYLRLVVDEEWQSMAHGEAGPRAHAALAELHALYTAPEGGPLYESPATLLKELGEHRRQRLDDSRREIPAPAWVVLYAGAAVTVALFLLTAPYPRRAFVAMTLAGALAFALFLAGALHTRFDVILPVGPDAFLSALAGMEHRLQT